MSIEDRNLKAGAKLVARYKGKDHICEVVKTKDGVVYRLQDGKEFTSPSSAGSAVMGGSACNGWRFWSLAGEAKQTAKKAAAKKGKDTLTSNDVTLPDRANRANRENVAAAATVNKEPTTASTE